MRDTQTREWTPFWCTLLVFTWSDRQWFMPYIIVNKAKDYTQYNPFNIPLDWLFHHTLPVYINRHGQLKDMHRSYTLCAASTVNNKIIFFSVNYIHFDDCTLCYTEDQNIQPFVLKSVNSGNDQPKNNGSNRKMKSY